MLGWLLLGYMMGKKNYYYTTPQHNYRCPFCKKQVYHTGCSGNYKCWNCGFMVYHNTEKEMIEWETPKTSSSTAYKKVTSKAQETRGGVKNESRRI